MFRKAKTAACAILAAALIFCGSAGASDDLQPIVPQQVAYKTAKVTRGNLERNEVYGAELFFPLKVSVKLPRSGRFMSGVLGGTYVREGDVIATFTVPDNSEAVYEAKLNYELAEAQYRSAVDTAKAAVANAATELDHKAAQASLDYVTYSGRLAVEAAESTYTTLQEAGQGFTLTATANGYVGNIAHASGGEMQAGRVYCVISRTEKIQLRVSAEPNAVGAAERIALLTVGSEAAIIPIRADAPSFKGRVVSNTSVLGDNTIQPYAIVEFENQAEFDAYAAANPAAIGDTKYHVSISRVDIRGVLLCPRNAVQKENTFRYVNVLEGGILKKRYVLAALYGSETVLIFGGLSEGDEVILP